MAKNNTAAKRVPETETIYIPKKSRDDDAQYIAVNGKRYLIKKGVPVRVPKFVAAVWHNAEEQQRKAEAYISAVTLQ